MTAHVDQQIGILGGTFDPIHLAHLRLAEEAREQLHLSQVLFMPAPQPWRKVNRPIAPVADRLAMVRLATASNPFFSVSTVEIEHDGPTYTANTLAVLHRQFGPGVTFHFILGADALLDLPNWHAPQRIIAQTRLSVAARAGTVIPDNTALEAWVPGVTAVIELFVMPELEISSTDIRRRAVDSRSLRYLVPAPVAGYIDERGLYGEAVGSRQ